MPLEATIGLAKAIEIKDPAKITALASYYILAGANRVRRFLGETGIRILMRLMGLMLTALAVQFVLNGFFDPKIILPRS